MIIKELSGARTKKKYFQVIVLKLGCLHVYRSMENTILTLKTVSISFRDDTQLFLCMLTRHITVHVYLLYQGMSREGAHASTFEHRAEDILWLKMSDKQPI